MSGWSYVQINELSIYLSMPRFWKLHTGPARSSIRNASRPIRFNYEHVIESYVSNMRFAGLAYGIIQFNLNIWLWKKTETECDNCPLGSK